MALSNQIEILVKTEVDKAIRDINKFKGQAAGMGKSTGGVLNKIKGSWIALTAVIGTSILTFAKFISTAKNFEAAIARVASVAGKEATPALTRFAREAAVRTRFTAKEAADALFFLASAGLKVKDMSKVLTPALNLATAANLEIAEATDLVVGQLKTFQVNMGKAAEFADIMTKANQLANTDVRQLGEAMKFVSPVVAGLGVQFKDLNIMIAAMADIGIKGGMAGVQLRQAFTRLLRPTGAAKDALEKYGIKQEQINNLLDDPIELFKLLNPLTQDAGDAVALFGKRQSGVIAVIRDQIPRLEKLKKGMEDYGGAAEKAAEIQLATFEGKLKLLKSAFQDFVIRNTSQFLPALSNITVAITKLFIPEKKLRDITQELIKANRDYAKVTKTLADESADLTNKERAKLEVRKAELKLKITDAIKTTNKLYIEQSILIPQLVAKEKRLLEQYEKRSKRVKGLSEGTIKASRENIDFLGEELATRQDLEKAIMKFQLTQNSLAKVQLKLTKRTSEYNESIETLAIGLKNEIITKGDLIGLDKQLINKAIELSKTIKIEGDEYTTTGEKGKIAKEKILELTKKEEEILEASFNKSIELSQALFDFKKELRERELNERIAEIENARQNELSIENEFQIALNKLDEKAKQDRIKKLQEEIVAAKKAGDQELANEKQRELDRLILTDKAKQRELEINKKFDEQVKEAKREAFKKQKEADIIQAIINGIVAVTKTLASLPWPLNLIPAGIQAGINAVNIGLIASQPIPTFQQGGITSGGLALVGEGGAELAAFPAGTRIFNNQETNEILKSNIVIENLNLPGVEDPEQFFEEMQRFQRENGVLTTEG